MLGKLKPTFYFQHYTELTPDWLQTNGIKFILSDLDGTLAPHNEKESEEFSIWYESIEKAGTGLIIVSNNHQTRVDNFIQTYKIVGMGECQKPYIKKIKESLFDKGLIPETTLFLGDQLFTDIWCGNRLGVKTAWVKSIEGKEPWHTKPKRFIETFLLKRWNIT